MSVQLHVATLQLANKTVGRLLAVLDIWKVIRYSIVSANGSSVYGVSKKSECLATCLAL